MPDSSDERSFFGGDHLSIGCTFALQGGQLVMARSAKASKPSAAPKASRPVTLKHLAAILAEEHDLTKRAGEAFLVGLVGRFTNHPKKGARTGIARLGIMQGLR